jgi:hypothetical protein
METHESVRLKLIEINKNSRKVAFKRLRDAGSVPVKRFLESHKYTVGGTAIVTGISGTGPVSKLLYKSNDVALDNDHMLDDSVPFKKFPDTSREVRAFNDHIHAGSVPVN